MRLIDLRSDTVTRPTAGMRQAMANAEVGDDVFGDDPTVARLQDRVAELLGKEAALFVPSGTMANQIALAVLTRPGDEVFCEAGCHIFNYEGGAPGLIAGVQLHPVAGQRGVIQPAQLEELLRPDDSHFPPPTAVAVENTHNRAGGCVWPLESLRAIAALCRQRGLALHLDGARLWNAAVASAIPERTWAAEADTVSVCFSKGLGAPVGSAIASTRARIALAHRMRKRLGGGMRQAGIIAAGALYALEHHRERLAEDHRRARRLAEGLAEIHGFALDPAGVDTDIVIFEVTRPDLTGPQVAAALKAHGVLVTGGGQRTIRMVTHLDVDDRDIDQALAIVHKLYGSSS